tara:strand:- start:2476 stop:5436 length:2961 start_codon:yes stop_codon:yes gene_type:complete
MTTKSFFVDINRYSAQDSESDTTNIWDYKLNNTILASAGSSISIENAFINQKGITGQSIEFEEDFVETIQYYAYITEDQQSIPSALSFSGNNIGLTSVLYDDLLNNLGDTGRTKLFLNGNEGSIATSTYGALNGFELGGSGTPLILSTRPFQKEQSTITIEAGGTTYANNKTLAVNTAGIEVGMSITTTTAGVLDVGVRVVSITDATNLVMSRFPIKASGVEGIPCVFKNNPDFVTQPVPLTAFITIKKGVYGIQQLTTIINKQFNNQYLNGTTIPLSNVESQLANRNWDGTLNDGNSGFTHQIQPLEMRPSPDGMWRRNIFEEDPSTVPTHCFIPAWDYANERPNYHPFQKPVQINYSRRADDTHTDNGPIYYLQDNNKRNIFKKQVYTLLLTKGSKDFEISKRHSISVGDRVEGANIMKGTTISSVSGAGDKDISMNNPYIGETGAETLYIYSDAEFTKDTDGQELKNTLDYQIGVRGLMVGAPEVNIQFDTDSSAFTLNNLHASYRIASHDILGNENTSAGKVGVGLKRIAEIFDIQPWGAVQEVWGTAGAVANHTGNVHTGRNIIYNLVDSSSGQNSVDNIAIGATIVGDGFPLVGGVAAKITAVGESIQQGDINYEYAVEVDRLSTETHYPSQRTYQIVNQGTTDAVKSTIRSCLETPVSRIGGVMVFNFAKSTALKYGDKNLDDTFETHASYEDFFSSRKQAEKIWKTKTLWGKLGFSYDQLNSEEYMETIAQYNKTGGLKLRGITTNTKLDISTIPQVSTQNNPTKGTMSSYIGGVEVNSPLQYFNNFDYSTPRTQRTTRVDDNSQTNNGDNIQSYAGSRYNMATMINVEANPTPITADKLPSLSKFGYYLITSDLVPTYKDIVSKGDPLGLLGIVAKTNLSNQDFIPVAGSEIVQMLNEDTPIQNIKVKVLNPDLTNPELSENSSIIIRIDVPIPPPSPPPKDGEKKHKEKRCPKTGEKICRCPPNEVGKKMESGKKK